MIRCFVCGVHRNDAGNCNKCGACPEHCECDMALFDADELGLDPETDNEPTAGSRHA